MTRSNELPSLNGIRAVCIALVIGSHEAEFSPTFSQSWRHTAGYLVNGALGVRLFFVLSGFLITYLLVQEEHRNNRISLSRFYVRRALRILPVCYALVCAVATLDFFLHLDIPKTDYLTSVTYTKDFNMGGWLMAHLWSLSVEEQFYLFWPFVMAFCSKRGRVSVAAACVLAAPICRVILHLLKLDLWGSFSIFSNVDALMIGSLAGIASAEKLAIVDRILQWRPPVARALAALSIYLVWAGSMNETALRWKFGWFTLPFGPSVQAVAAAYLIASYSTVRTGRGYAFLNVPWVRYVGVLSYSLYIWQQLFTGPLYAYHGLRSVWIEFPLNLATLFVVSWCSYNLLELPLLRLRRKYRAEPIANVEPEIRPEVAPA